MLRGSIAFVVLVVFAMVGTEARTYFASKGIRAPAMEGLSFLVLGFALGERMLGLFPASILEMLHPVMLLGIAWIGLVFGLQVDFSIIRRLRLWQRRIGFLIPFLIGACIFIAAALFDLGLPIAATLASVAAATSSSTLASLVRARVARDPSALRLLRVTIAFAGIPAIFIFHAAAVMWGPMSSLGGGSLPAWQMPLALFSFGFIVGYAMLFFGRGVLDSVHMLTLMIGCMAVTAGIAAMLGLSALVPAAVAGAVVINRCIFPNRFLKVGHSMERPLLVALLVLVGASWSGGSFSWTVFAVMVPIRFVVVFGAGFLLRKVAQANHVGFDLRSVGLGLLPQGELALGVLVASLPVIVDVPGVLEAVIVAMVVNNLISQYWLRLVLFEPQKDVETCPE